MYDDMHDMQAKLSQIILQRHGESTADQVDDALHAAAFGDSCSLGKPLTPGPCSLSADGLKEFRDARCVRVLSSGRMKTVSLFCCFCMYVCM